jgi:hypothetical protein
MFEGGARRAAAIRKRERRKQMIQTRERKGRNYDETGHYALF